jgi:hypothetical protein
MLCRTRRGRKRSTSNLRRATRAVWSRSRSGRGLRFMRGSSGTSSMPAFCLDRSRWSSASGALNPVIWTALKNRAKRDSECWAEEREDRDADRFLRSGLLYNLEDLLFRTSPIPRAMQTGSTPSASPLPATPTVPIWSAAPVSALGEVAPARSSTAAPQNSAIPSA